MIKLLLLLSFLLITSCADRLYGPKLINNYKKDLHVSTYHTDGKVFSGYLSNCEKSFIGRGGAIIERVIISIDNEVNFDLSGDELKDYLNSDSDGLLYWVISKDKIDVFENKTNVSKSGNTVCKIR